MIPLFVQKYAQMAHIFLVLFALLFGFSCVVEVQPVGPARSLDGGVGGGGGSGGAGGNAGIGGGAGSSGSGGESGTGGSGGIAGTGGSGGNAVGEPCTVATQDEDCGGKTCNPVTLECSDFGKWDRGVCETCVSDENCWESSHRCVPMFFDGERYPNDHTGFCLREAQPLPPGDNYECNGEEPYVTVLYDRESISGAGPSAYCGPREDFTTCDAVDAQIDEIECTAGSDDDCPTGGICRYTQDNGKWDYRCTYYCTADAECANRQGWELDCAGFCGT